MNKPTNVGQGVRFVNGKTISNGASGILRLSYFLNIQLDF